MRWFRVLMAPALMASLSLPASFAWAETEDALDERLEQVQDESQAVRREAAEIGQKTRNLEIRRNSLRESLRVGHPFRQRRELRIDLQGNESRGRWYENESRRLDFSTRRNQRNLRRLRRSGARG